MVAETRMASGGGITPHTSAGSFPVLGQSGNRQKRLSISFTVKAVSQPSFLTSSNQTAHWQTVAIDTAPRLLGGWGGGARLQAQSRQMAGS